MLKKTEARILIYIFQSYKNKKTCKHMRKAFNMDYYYLNTVLRIMIEKTLIKRFKKPKDNNHYYELTEYGSTKIKEAKEVLANG